MPEFTDFVTVAGKGKTVPEGPARLRKDMRSQRGGVSPMVWLSMSPLYCRRFWWPLLLWQVCTRMWSIRVS